MTVASDDATSVGILLTQGHEASTATGGTAFAHQSKCMSGYISDSSQLVCTQHNTFSK